jgi:hypothetical protein
MQSAIFATKAQGRPALVQYPAWGMSRADLINAA